MPAAPAATRTRTRKPKPAVNVLHDVNAPEVIQAVQIGFAVMAAAKTETWAQAISLPNLDALVRLTFDQQAIIRAHRYVLPNIRRRGPVISVEACPACGRWGWSASPVPKKCSWTMGCEGTPVKAAATAWKPPTIIDLYEPSDEPHEEATLFDLEVVL